MATILALALSALLLVAAPEPDPQPTTTAMSSADEALAEHVPSDLRSSCVPTTDNLPPGATAQLDCSRAADEIPNYAAYTQFRDAASMNAFATDLAGSEPLVNDACNSVADLQNGGKATYTVDDKPRGTVRCYRNDDNAAVLVWTDDVLNITVVATETHDAHFEAFLEWYRHAGPI